MRTAGRRDRDRVDVSVLSSGHDVADARLHRLVLVLLEAGLSVEVLGLGDRALGPSGARLRTWRRGSRLRRALRALQLPALARGRVQMVLDPELVLPAMARRALARCTGRQTGRQVVVDVHEDYAKLLLDRDWATGVRLRAARALVAVSVAATTMADLTVVADAGLPPQRARRRQVLTNQPLLRLLPQEGRTSTEPRAVYVGDVRRSRGLQSMLAVLEQCPDWYLDVVGPVAAQDRAWLDRWSASSPARGRVTFHGRLPPRDAWRLAARAWVGLCLLEPTPAFRVALPSKILEYLACGLAVVTTPLPRAESVVRDSGAGHVVADADGAVDVLRRWSEAPALVRRHRSAATAWADRHLRDLSPYEAFAAAVGELAEGTPTAPFRGRSGEDGSQHDRVGGGG